MIPFNIPPSTGNEIDLIAKAISDKKLCGDGFFTKQCTAWIEKHCKTSKALLTTSCTHALEMAAILAGIQSGDEVIMPSYTFVSTANAFVMRGARIRFVDIRPDTMNIDENIIKSAITSKTKAIVPVHYAGVSCNMDKVLEIAKNNNILVIEDAAQGVMSKYKGNSLGSLGNFGCFSFHETKNYTMGEGGAICIQDKANHERAEIIREKGTNRSNFLRGQVDKYTWIDIGSSYLPSDLNAAYLYAQLDQADLINNNRLNSWKMYYDLLHNLASKGCIELPYVPEDCQHNAHMFYIKVKNIEERSSLMKFLYSKGIQTTFHYIPLHSSPAGLKYGNFVGEDKYTTQESERLLRLPMYYGLRQIDIEEVCNSIDNFYGGAKQ